MRARTVWAALGIATVVAAGVVYNDYRADLAAARARIATGTLVQTACGPIEYVERGGTLVQTACGPIEYVERGRGDDVLLFVHGAGGGFDQGLGFGDAFAEAGYRTLFVSRFGYLGTPLPLNAGPEAQADAHACLLDALGIKRVAIMGVSAGAPSSMQFAIRHPERTAAMVLLVPATYAPKPEGQPVMDAPSSTEVVFQTALRFDFLYWAAIKLAHDLLTESILATPIEVADAAAPAEQARADRMLKDILPIKERRLGLLNDARVTSTMGRYDLERISAPTLVVSAADDLFGTYAAAQYTAANVAGAKFVGYASGGHVWLGHHQDVLDETVKFLDALRGLPRPDVAIGNAPLRE